MWCSISFHDLHKIEINKHNSTIHYFLLLQQENHFTYTLLHANVTFKNAFILVKVFMAKYKEHSSAFTSVTPLTLTFIT